MAIPIACGSCGKQIKAPDKYAGRIVKCPKCGNSIGVPGMQSVGEATGPIVNRESLEAGLKKVFNPSEDEIKRRQEAAEVVAKDVGTLAGGCIVIMIVMFVLFCLFIGFIVAITPAATQ